MRKETVDTDILVTSGNGDRKIMQSMSCTFLAQILLGNLGFLFTRLRSCK